MILWVDWAKLGSSLLGSIMMYVVNPGMCRPDPDPEMNKLLQHLLGVWLTALSCQSFSGKVSVCEGHLTQGLIPFRE